MFLGSKMMKVQNIKVWERWIVWCNRCDVMVSSKRRYFCKEDGEVWKSLEIYAAK